MVIIEAGVEYGNNSAGAVVSEVGAIEYTGFINVNGVFDDFGFAGVVNFTDDNVSAVADNVANFVEVLCLSVDFNATQKGVIGFTYGVIDTAIFKLVQEGSGVLVNFRADALSLGRARVL